MSHSLYSIFRTKFISIHFCLHMLPCYEQFISSSFVLPLLWNCWDSEIWSCLFIFVCHQPFGVGSDVPDTVLGIVQDSQ